MIRLKRPLVILAIIFSFGISSAAKTKPTFMPLYFTAAALSVLAVILRKRKAFFNAGIFFLVFLLGMASLVNARVMPSCHISGLIPYIKEKTYIIKGHIADAPAGDKDFVSFRLDAEQVYAEGRDNSCCGQVIVYTRGSRKDWHYGQSVILRGSLYRPFLRSQGIDFIMRVKSDADISRLDGAGGSKIIKIALGIKNKIERAIFRHVASGAAG
ncbi:MAG: ComEC/Rec2 family competence protein, partial [Deltaproteobacteria bacterium]